MPESKSIGEKNTTGIPQNTMSSSLSTNGKGSKWRTTDFHKYQQNWPKSMGPKKDARAGIRCEYHNYEDGVCTHCGKTRLLTRKEAVAKVRQNPSSGLIVFGH